uniref:Uncharacterized protein n=1 Tax=Myoviridae sp. ct2Pw37 TaxID=2825021 RepID=A0A8S5PAT7_9CAUD|nr:MAG TPA: hypothetical protein [Myoviridae sp. ct2Pw37]
METCCSLYLLLLVQLLHLCLTFQLFYTQYVYNQGLLHHQLVQYFHKIVVFFCSYNHILLIYLLILFLQHFRFFLLLILICTS